MTREWRVEEREEEMEKAARREAGEEGREAVEAAGERLLGDVCDSRRLSIVGDLLVTATLPSAGLANSFARFVAKCAVNAAVEAMGAMRSGDGSTAMDESVTVSLSRPKVDEDNEVIEVTGSVRVWSVAV